MQFDYFQQLTQDLQQQGTGTPQLILDLAQYQQNLEIVQAKIPAQLKPRLVVKTSESAVRAIRMLGNIFRYQSDCTIARKSAACLAERSLL